jgi:hypothetical protein
MIVQQALDSHHYKNPVIAVAQAVAGLGQNYEFPPNKKVTCIDQEFWLNRHHVSNVFDSGTF